MCNTRLAFREVLPSPAAQRSGNGESVKRPPHHHSHPCLDVAVVVIFVASTLSAQCCSINHHACRVVASVLCVFSCPGLTYPRVRVAGLDTIAGEIFCVRVGRTSTCRPPKQRIRLTLRCHFGETMAPAPPGRRTTPAATKTLAAVFAVVLCASTAPLVQAGCPSGAFPGVCARARVDGAAVVHVVGCNSQRVWAVTHVRVVSTGSSLMSNSASTYDIKELCTWHGWAASLLCCACVVWRSYHVPSSMRRYRQALRQLLRLVRLVLRAGWKHWTSRVVLSYVNVDVDVCACCDSTRCEAGQGRKGVDVLVRLPFLCVCVCVCGIDR